MVKVARHAAAGLPPGPKGLPILGSLLSLQKEPHIRINDIVRKYGDVCTIRLGGTPTVVISHPLMLREAFTMRELSDRWTGKLLNALTAEATDLIFGRYDERWRQLQSYANKNILSHRRIATVRDLYVEPMMDFLVESVGKAADSGELLYPSEFVQEMNARTMTNIIFGNGGVSYKEIMTKRLEHFLRVLNWGFTKVSVVNLSSYLPSWLFTTMPNSNFKRAEAEYRILDGIIDFDAVADDRRFMFDIDNPQCLMEVMLSDLREGLIDTKEIESIVADLMMTGTDTSSQTMAWFILTLANRPHIQESVHEELAELAKKENRSELGVDDMPRLPYTFAALTEMLRLNPTAPVGLAHRARKTCHFAGYTIPEGAQILGNLYGIHRDERFWEDPHEFRVERFMPLADGSLSPNLENEAYIPFGVGRRGCPGHGLAMTVIWLQIARLFLNFRFEPTTEALSEEAHFGIILRPKPFAVKVTRR